MSARTSFDLIERFNGSHTFVIGDTVHEATEAPHKIVIIKLEYNLRVLSVLSGFLNRCFVNRSQRRNITPIIF